MTRRLESIRESRPVLILLGPTCVGKTEISLLLAQSLGTEIIGADSMQIYRHMDIGTAKPSPRERAMVRHHMIDIVEPSEDFSAGKYVEAVTPIIDNLHKRGRVPIIVGGAGLYIRAMTRGIFRGPSADWGLREKLLRMEEGESGRLYALLREHDPEAASRIMPGDTRRVIRALEVCLKSGSGISALQKGFTSPLPYRFIKVGLTRARSELYGLIDRRVDTMISRGLVDEVRKVLKLSPGRTALQAIGYKEIAAHFRNEYSLDEAVRLIKKRTRNYARRQFTWFRTEEGIIWTDLTGRTGPEETVRAIALLVKIN